MAEHETETAHDWIDVPKGTNLTGSVPFKFCTRCDREEWANGAVRLGATKCASSPPGQSGTEAEGCIDAPHDHVDQCYQAGRAEVEAKYAALVAAVEGLLGAPIETTPCAKVIVPDPALSWTHGYSAAMENVAYVLAVLADPAEGGDR